MNKLERQIQDLLKSQIAVNNSLAFELIQSQWDWSVEKTLRYIFEFQVKSFWTKKTSSYSFEVDIYKFKLYLEEEDDIYVYGLDLVCSIETPKQTIYEKEYLGTFDYSFGFGSNEPDNLLENKDKALELFDFALSKLFQS